MSRKTEQPQNLAEALELLPEQQRAPLQHNLPSMPFAQQVQALKPERPVQFNLDGNPPPLPEAQAPEKDTQFGKPYESEAEAKAAQAFLVTMFLPAITAAFGIQVGRIWDAFLSRRPGDSLEPWVYAEGDEIGDAFARDQMTHLVTQHILYASVQTMTAPGFEQLAGYLKPGEWANVPVEELINGPDNIEGMNFSNPVTIPGNLAGGVGAGAGGGDKRQVSGFVSVLSEAKDNQTTLLDFKPAFVYKVIDTVDFLPGDAGSGIEQVFTVPLSRLEASGLAYDVPIEVNFGAPDTRIGAELPELVGKEKHLASVIEVAATAKEKGLSAAATLVTEKAKTLKTETLAKVGAKAEEMLSGGKDALAQKIADKISDVAGPAIDSASDKAADWLLKSLFG
ncbi:MAG: hypothetical protein KC561_00800 [Myxococcales bacterium]|nr:hypothetical protein [Myxococcales bacterium]